MQVKPDDMLRCAYKLLETFSPPERGDPFPRYWTLAAALETFSESATGAYEEAVAKTLRKALETRLKQFAAGSFALDAQAIAVHLGAAPKQSFAQRRQKHRRRPRSDRRR